MGAGHSFPKRIVLAVYCACAAPFVLSAQPAPAASELLARMKSVLGAERDFFSRLIVRTDGPTSLSGSPPAEYYYFRSDGRRSFLLYQCFPRHLIGFAFLRKTGTLQAYNPQCACSSETGGDVMRLRVGFSFEELSPMLSADRAIKGSVSAGRAGGEAALIVILSAPDPREADVRLSLSPSSGLPLLIEYVNKRGEAMRTVVYEAYYEIENRYFPKRLRVFERGGNALVAEFAAPSYHPLPDFVFTKAYLEELSK